MNAARACTLARALALGRQVDASASRLGETDGDRLARGARAVFSLADVLHLLADELARDGARRLTGARLAARAFQCAFFGHGISFRKVFSTRPSRARARRAASATGRGRRG